MALILRTFERTSVRRSRKRQLNLHSAQYSFKPDKIKPDKNQTKLNKQKTKQRQTTNYLKPELSDNGKAAMYSSLHYYAHIVLSAIRK